MATHSNILGFPGGSGGEEPACNSGDLGSISALGRYPGEGGNPLQYSCLENFMDRRAWQDTVLRVSESHMTERLTQYYRNNISCTGI